MCIRLKQAPLSSDSLIAYTGLELSDPSAKQAWSFWLTAEANTGNVNSAQDVLESMRETQGVAVELDAELNVIASAVAYNISVTVALQSFESLLEDGRCHHLLFVVAVQSFAPVVIDN